MPIKHVDTVFAHSGMTFRAKNAPMIFGTDAFHLCKIGITFFAVGATKALS